MANNVLTEAGTVTAHAKLPDDLVYDEFTDLVDAVHRLVTNTRAGVHSTGQSTRAQAETPVFKVQYGSDFLVVIGVAAAAGAAFVAFAKGLDFLAGAGLKNEDRLAKRDERLARRSERSRIVRESSEPRGNVQNVGLSIGTTGFRMEMESRSFQLSIMSHADVEREIERPIPKSVYLALVTLAEYGVELEVSEPEDDQSE